MVADTIYTHMHVVGVRALIVCNSYSMFVVYFTGQGQLTLKQRRAVRWEWTGKNLGKRGWAVLINSSMKKCRNIQDESDEVDSELDPIFVATMKRKQNHMTRFPSLCLLCTFTFSTCLKWLRYFSSSGQGKHRYWSTSSANGGEECWLHCKCVHVT